MDKETRVLQLKTLVGHLLTKYDLSNHSCSHICFYIKPQDVIDIVNNYHDLIDSSNLYISPAGKGLHSYNTDKFKVYTGEHWFGVESKVYERKNNFKSSVDMKEVMKIQVDISCEVILTFEFIYSDNEYSQYSFRYD